MTRSGRGDARRYVAVIDHPIIRPRRRVVVIAVSLAALLALAAPSIPAATAQGAADGTFSISPSRRDLVGRPPATLIPTRVSNTTKGTYDVRVFPVLLRQDLSGAFQFDESPRPLMAAGRILRVSASRFQLAPGQSRQVGLRWELLPLDARAAYIGVVFQGQRRVAGGGSVPVVGRLLSINFLRLPGRYHPNGRFTALRAIQSAPRKLRILARVKNTGDIVASPKRARLAIHDTAGRTVFKTGWKGDLVLPRAEREFPIDVRKVLPAGDYTAQAVMRFGARRRAKISTAFTLVSPNELPTPGLAIKDFAALGEVGRPAHITGQVQSTGTAPAKLALTLSLFRVTGGVAEAKPLAGRKLRFSGLQPGSTRSLDVDLTERMTPGDYRVVGEYTDAAGAPQELTSDFAATTRRGFLERLELFFKRNTPLIILVIAVLVIIAIGESTRRYRRRLRAKLIAGASEPAPAPNSHAPQDDRLDLNTATADQLAMVPGIGVNAAARIIAHRDEFGRFGSCAELTRIEGFDAERVVALEPYLRLYLVSRPPPPC